MLNQPIKWIHPHARHKFVIRADRADYLRNQWPALKTSRRARYWLAMLVSIAGKGEYAIRAHRAAWYAWEDLKWEWWEAGGKKLQKAYVRLAEEKQQWGTSALIEWLKANELPGTIRTRNVDGKNYIYVSCEHDELIAMSTEIGYIAKGINLYDLRPSNITTALVTPPYTVPEGTDIIRSTLATAGKRHYAPSKTLAEISAEIDAHYGVGSEESVRHRNEISILFSDGFRPAYKSSDEVESARIFAAGVSVQSIPSWIKRSIYPQWREIDLQSAWATIAASFLGVKLPTDLWSDLTESITRAHVTSSSLSVSLSSSSSSLLKDPAGGAGAGARSSVPPLLSSDLIPTTSQLETTTNRTRLSATIPTKSDLKPFLYSMICGQSPSHVRGELTKSFGKEISDIISDTAWWLELGTKCAAWRDDYATNNATTVVEARRAMALKLNRIEQELISTVYRVSLRYDRVTIVSAEHDGCAVVCSSEKDWAAFFKECVAAVATKAREYDIPVMNLVEKTAIEPDVTTNIEEDDIDDFDYMTCDFA